MKTPALILPFALWIAASGAAADETPEALRDNVDNTAAAQAVQKAGVALNQGHVDVAIEEASKAAQLYEKGQGTAESLYVCAALDLKANALLYKPGGYANALPLAQHCLLVREKLLGRDHPYVAASLESVAACSMGVQRWDDAAAALERVAALYQKLGGELDSRRLAALGHLADVHQVAGKMDQAKRVRAQLAALQARANKPRSAQDLIAQADAAVQGGNARCDQVVPLYAQAQALLEKQKKPSLELARIMRVQAQCLMQDPETAERALTMLRGSVAIYSGLLKDNDPAIIPVLTDLAQLAENLNRVDEAITLRTRVLEVTRASFGARSELTAGASVTLGMLHKSRGAFSLAVPFIQQGRSVLESLEKDVLGQVRLLSTEAEIRREMGDYDAAAPLYVEALKRLDTLPAAETKADRGSLLQNQALMLKQTGVLPQAEKQYREALALEEEALGPDALDLSYPLNNLAELLRDQARFDEAAPLYERCLNIRLKHVGHDHPLTATVIQNKALLAINRGNDAEAYALFEEALAVYEAVLPAEHPLLANTRRNLAAVYRERGDHVRAEALLKTSMATEARMLGPEHPWVAESHTQLGMLYLDMGRGDDALAEFNAAFTLREKRLGRNHPDTLVSLINQGEMLRVMGKREQAMRITAEAQAGLEALYGPNHPVIGAAFNNLAVLKSDGGDHAGAEALFRKALAVREKALGTDHPNTTQTLSNLFHALAQLGRLDDAAATAQEWSNRRNRHFQRALGAGSERDRVLAAQSLSAEMYELASVHAVLARNHPAFTRALATETLRNKGRALDAMAASLSALRERLEPKDRELLDTLTALKSRYASGYDTMTPEQLGLLGRKLDETERLLAQRSAQFQLEQLVVDVDTVTAALPEDAAMLEFLEFSPTLTGEQKDRHLAALVLRRGQPPAWEDLGPALAVQDAVRALRAVLEAPQHPDAAPTAGALHALVLAPLERHLSNVTLLLLSPIPEMQSLPWAALQDARGRLVVQQYAVVVLGSGRDVLRFQALGGRGNKSLVLANPDFGKVTQEGDSTRGGKRGLRNTEFVPLPGTAQEAKAVAPLIRDARTLTGKDATEDALKKAQAPRILHVATHGFFMGDQEETSAAPSATRSRGLTLRKGEVKEPEPPPPEPFLDAWLQSGLALSNANSATADGKQNGVVTALEMSAVNLWGTRLVVLSACQTGLGTVVHGEGVLGLRRAVTLAGAQSQVMSLWNVDDDATRDLMVAFYKNLSKGMGRAQALQQAQLTLLRSPRYKHPYYWSAFSFGGDWRPLQ